MSSAPGASREASDEPSSSSTSEGVVYAAHFDFDPIATSSSSDEESAENANSDEDFGVARNAADVLPYWCHCGQCRQMDTATENICCHSIAKVHAKMEGRACITAHPTFIGGILNVHSIEIAYLHMMALNQEQVNAVDIHRRYRNTAYYNFARWIWHRLGRHNRRPLPSCVVLKIRKTFPSEQYAGFRYVDF